MNEEAKQTGYGRTLRQERLQSARTEAAGSESVGEPADSAEASSAIPLVIAGLFSSLSDFADFFGIPALPLIGDPLDVATGGINSLLLLAGGGTSKTKMQAFVWSAALFELLPFGINDLLPAHSVGIIVAWHIAHRAAERTTQDGY